MIKKITSIQQNFHLYRNKNGSFFYRQVIPKDVRSAFTISEIKRSLYTDNIHYANITSLLISNIISVCINNIRCNHDYYLNITEINATITEIINLNKVGGSDYEAIDTLSILRCNYISLQAARKKFSDMPLSCHFGSEYGGTKIGTKSIPTQSISLLEAINNYTDDMTLKNKWSIKTAYQMQHSNNLLLELIGNISIDKITREVLNDALSRLLRYPRNKNKLAKYRDLSIKELDNIDIPTEERLDLTTVKNIIGRWNSFLHWVYLNNDNIPAWIYQYIKVPKADKKALPNERRAIFTQEDIHTLFHSSEYMDDTFNKAYKFWLPLLGLFTGARLNELCQLTVEDIVVIDNLTCLKITEESSLEYLMIEKPDGSLEKRTFRKQLKNLHSVRTIPLHRKLIEIGFLNYVQKMIMEDRKILFPELIPDSLEGKLSRQVSRWFNGAYLSKLKIKRQGLCFHSFRHLFISTFMGTVENKQLLFDKDDDGNIDLIKLKRYVGHQTGKSITLTTYTKSFPPMLLMRDVLSHINYDIPIDILKQSKYARIS